MESGSQISEIWSCFKEYVDNKHIETVAERVVDLCADYGNPDEDFRNTKVEDRNGGSGECEGKNILPLYP